LGNLLDDLLYFGSMVSGSDIRSGSEGNVGWSKRASAVPLEDRHNRQTRSHQEFDGVLAREKRLLNGCPVTSDAPDWSGFE